MSQNILVSISCITFNHSKFINECLNGFLMQQTEFEYEIVIHDDASTDGTKEIIKEYVRRYPNIIFPFYQNENKYSKGIRGIMARYNFPRCRGKFIALCEGDDYWTDPLKLQKQVEFLKENPQFSFCSNYYYTRMGEKSEKMTLPYDEVNLENIFMKNIFSTASLLFREEAIKELPPGLFEKVSEVIGLYKLMLVVMGRVTLCLNI